MIPVSSVGLPDLNPTLANNPHNLPSYIASRRKGGINMETTGEVISRLDGWKTVLRELDKDMESAIDAMSEEDYESNLGHLVNLGHDAVMKAYNHIDKARNSI